MRLVTRPSSGDLLADERGDGGRPRREDVEHTDCPHRRSESAKLRLHIGPTTATELATAIGLDRTATTRYASRLQGAGLELTPAGHQAVAAMRRTLSQLFDDMLSTWKRDEAEQFAASLERFTTMLEQRK